MCRWPVRCGVNGLQVGLPHALHLPGPPRQTEASTTALSPVSHHLRHFPATDIATTSSHAPPNHDPPDHATAQPLRTQGRITQSPTLAPACQGALPPTHLPLHRHVHAQEAARRGERRLLVVVAAAQLVLGQAGEVEGDEHTTARAVCLRGDALRGEGEGMGEAGR